MEATEVQEQPASEVEASSASPSEESASPFADQSDISPESRAQMNALIRGLGQQAGSASKSDDDGFDDSPDDTSGASASTPEGVKPDGSPARPLGRRGAAAEVQRLTGEVERLSKALDEIVPKPPPDASEAARAQAIERENHYRRLLVMPDDDPSLYDVAPESVAPVGPGQVPVTNYTWLSQEKAKRALAPELTQHYDTVLAEDLKTHRASLERQYSAAWNQVKADLSRTLTLDGVTPEVKARLLAAPISEQILIHRQLERARIEPELQRLRDENADLRREMYGVARAPMGGGRSAGGPVYDPNDLMNDLIRGGRGRRLA